MFRKICLLLFVTCFAPFAAHATWAVSSGLLSAGTLTVTTSAQTSTVSAAAVNGKSPWWSFSGTAGVTYHFDLCSSTTSNDPVLSIYSGASPGGALVSANDDYCGTRPGINFICPATQVYYVSADVTTGVSPFTFGNSGTVALSYYSCGTVSSGTPPISENWSGASVISTACTGWIAQGAGTEGDWFISSSTNAGGTAPELDFYGNQANMYGVGVAKTVTMTSYPINTMGVATMTFNWKHTLQLSSNSGASGTNAVTIKLQSSGDMINWTDQYSATYTVTGTSATPINKVTQSVTMNLNNQRTWLRFYMNAVPFKIVDWYIDNGTSTITLPVELSEFKSEAIAEGIKLNWKTASETNNDHFTLERSADGIDFSPLAIVQGAGNSSQAVSYTWTDHEPLKGLNYYRLKQTDRNGDFSWSDIISEYYLHDRKRIGTVFPNPATNEAEVAVFFTSSLPVRVEIFDLTGQKVLSEVYTFTEGWQKLKLPLSDLAKGMYYLVVITDNGKTSLAQKLVKE